jgi:hypothetical protein
MAYNDPNTSENLDESADTASFQRFVERDGGQPADTGSGRGFRLLSLGIGAVVLVLLVILLLQ